MKELGDPTIKAGDEVNIMGIPAKVSSQAEIDDMAVKGDMYCVCMPCVYGPSAVPNSTVARCGDCGCDVWMSPATKATMPLEAFIRCIRCILKLTKEGPET